MIIILLAIIFVSKKIYKIITDITLNIIPSLIMHTVLAVFFISPWGHVSTEMVKYSLVIM